MARSKYTQVGRVRERARARTGRSGGRVTEFTKKKKKIVNLTCWPSFTGLLVTPKRVGE